MKLFPLITPVRACAILTAIAVLAHQRDATYGQDGAKSDSEVTLESLLPIHRQAAVEYQISLENDSGRRLRLSSTPITQWTNIRRSGGQLGHVFVWMDDEEPAAMAAIFSFPWGGDEFQRRVVHELHALSPQQLGIQRSVAGTLWKPESGLKRQPLPGVNTRVNNLARFKIRTRQISRRFSGSCVDKEGQRWELRVLPTPLMIYPIERGDLQGFGALIGMMGDVGSDLESGCLIEATRSKSDANTSWQFAPIRMTDMETHLLFDGKPIWESVRTTTDTSFYDTPKVYFRFQDRTVAFESGE